MDTTSTKAQRRDTQAKISKFVDININALSFQMLTIRSDDTTAHDTYYESYNNPTLSKWADWCEEQGTYIDIGAHTGIYSLACLFANTENNLVSIEPLPINYYRILTNMRLNGLDLFKRCSLFNVAVSDQIKKVKFSTASLEVSQSYLSKGSKIVSEGMDMQAISIDSLRFGDAKTQVKGIKIDTEGEDYKVLIGGEKMIRQYMPKIMIETRKENYKDIINFLTSAGYNKIYTINQENEINTNLELDFNSATIHDICAEKI